MFRFSQSFPEKYHNYILQDYFNKSGFCTKWRSEIIGYDISYTCHGYNGYYVFIVRNDSIIISITYYSDTTGKIEIDSFGDKSVQCVKIDI
jgi:hypothetical protein